jgi:MFS transporter, DHA3 family, macrolide efflux protein
MGQTVSILGSAMTWFAFTIWAWQKTGQPTTLSMVAFFAFLPTVLFTPLAGVFVDRWSRKLVMLLSDAATAVGTLVVLFLYLSSSLEIWHVYIISALAGFFTAFQYPAYIAAVTTMLPKQKYGHAQGMLGLSPAISGIMAPVIAASLLGRIGMQGIMLLDLVTFLFAFATLIFVRIPAPSVSQAGLVSRSNVWREIGVGFTYIRERVGLRDLTILFMVSNFFLAIGATLVAPMVLSNTGNSESILASVQSVGAAGGVLGGVVLTFWGGPKRRVHGILLGGAGACIIGVLWLGLGTTFLVWAIGSFFFAFFEPIVEGGNLAIWQTKVEADIQGRVFSARQLLVQIPYLLGIFVAGPLAEYLFGISTMLVLAGVLGGFVFLAGYAVRPVRQVESLLPDQGD